MKLQNNEKFQNNAINDVKLISLSHVSSTSNHMFKREIWDKFTELTFLKFWNLPDETRDIFKSQKMSKVNFPQISRINQHILIRNYNYNHYSENGKL